MSTLHLSAELLAPVERYALMAHHAAGEVVIDTGRPFDKRRKGLHRFTIADTRGILTLTIPVAKPVSYHSAVDADILLSDHAPWWNTVMTALESAYGRTPYFEFYADDVAALLCRERVGTPVVELCRALDEFVCPILDIPTPRYARLGEGKSDAPQQIVTPAALQPYYQVRAAKHGFLPGLSIVDLVFNMGSEAPFIIRGLR